MELNEVEQKILKEIWSDELKRNTVQKAIVIATAADPEITAKALHLILHGIASQIPDEEDEE